MSGRDAALRECCGGERVREEVASYIIDARLFPPIAAPPPAARRFSRKLGEFCTECGRCGATHGLATARRPELLVIVFRARCPPCSGSLHECGTMQCSWGMRSMHFHHAPACPPAAKARAVGRSLFFSFCGSLTGAWLAIG
jgi:hypothetical protein